MQNLANKRFIKITINFFLSVLLICHLLIAMEEKQLSIAKKKNKLPELELREDLPSQEDNLETQILNLKLGIKSSVPAVTEDSIKFVRKICRLGTSKFSKKHLALLDENMLLINAINEHGETPLDVAVRYGKWKLVRALIERGARIMDPIFISAIQKYDLAANKGTVKDIIEYMLSNGANPNAKFGDISVWNAFLKKHKYTDTKSICGLAELLVKYGADINLKIVTLKSRDKIILVTPPHFALEQGYGSDIVLMEYFRILYAFTV